MSTGPTRLEVPSLDVELPLIGVLAIQELGDIFQKFFESMPYICMIDELQHEGVFSVLGRASESSSQASLDAQELEP
ncbi:hypothetical protein VNO78_33586 [Psophocarpus tetragonolobus]|uniref:Uncharacterized protein n=1 Tax=Psophocarpus tetragonolobus TaxID=3891 RepID=A0AAN9RQU0_PSOTE